MVIYWGASIGLGTAASCCELRIGRSYTYGIKLGGWEKVRTKTVHGSYPYFTWAMLHVNSQWLSSPSLPIHVRLPVGRFYDHCFPSLRPLCAADAMASLETLGARGALAAVTADALAA